MAPFKPKTWGLSRVILDIRNYTDFIRTIKKERDNPKSKWAKWKLNHNAFYTIFFTMDIEESELALPTHIMRLKTVRERCSTEFS